MSDLENPYYSYLKNRNWKGRLYRKYWLYPAICRNIGQDEKVLDVGCGIGDFLRYRKNTFGVEINEKAVFYCLKEGFNVCKMEADVLPFQSSVFDCVVLDNVLEHIQEPEPILKEINRVLNKKGKVIIGVPGKKGFDRDSDHKIFYDKNRLLECLESNGFKVKKTFYMPFKFDWFNQNISQYCLYGIFTQ